MKSNKESNQEEKKEPEEFFLEQLRDSEWVARLAYLADIFDLLSELNIGTQGSGSNCFKYFNKVAAFKIKLAEWKSNAEKDDLDMFPFINDMIRQNNYLLHTMKPIVTSHLERIIVEFEARFPANTDPRTNHLWIVDPFLNLKEKNCLTRIEQNQLIGKTSSVCPSTWNLFVLFIFSVSTELNCNQTTKNLFKELTLEEIWLMVRNGYDELGRKALNRLLQFSTTYLCESAFSTMAYLKSKYRNRLNAEHAMFMAITKINPRIDRFSSTVFKKYIRLISFDIMCLIHYFCIY